MTNNPENFWDAFDKIRAEVRQELIVREKVIPIGTDLSAQKRWELHMNSLEAAILGLRMVSEAQELTVTKGHVELLNTVELQASSLREKLNLRRSLVHLTGQFGRAAP